MLFNNPGRIFAIPIPRDLQFDVALAAADRFLVDTVWIVNSISDNLSSNTMCILRQAVI